MQVSKALYFGSGEYLEDIKFIIFGLVFFLVGGAFEYFRRNKPCEKCGGKMKVVGVKDPLGKNITKTTTIGISLGFPHDKLVKLKCNKCGQIKNEKWKS